MEKYTVEVVKPHMNAVKKSIEFILSRKMDITEQNPDFISHDNLFNSFCDTFYIRVGKRFYKVCSTTTLKDAYAIMHTFNNNITPSYIYNTTRQMDTLYGSIENVSKHCNRYLPFDYRKFYEEAIIKLRGNVRNKNIVYYTMIDIINSRYACGKESIAILKDDLRKAINYIKHRNTDYDVDKVDSDDIEDIECDYFSNASSMFIIIDGIQYDIDCFTSIFSAKHISDLLDNGVKIGYIYNRTKDVDSIVGDVGTFCRRNGITFGREFKYFYSLKKLNFDFNKDKIIEMIGE